jgi:hypothetical protein
MGSSAHEGSQLANTRYVTDARGAARLVVVVVEERAAGGREIVKLGERSTADSTNWKERV